MKIVPQSVILVSHTVDPDILIEIAGRTCYKSENKISKDSSFKFIENLIKHGHESVLEHATATFRIITDRGISHQIVRHRIASYSQESTRYIRYSELTVINPGFNENSKEYKIWYNSVKQAEETYKELLETGVPPQLARSVLPTCTKTELIMTANFREWRHFIKLRLHKRNHPQIRVIAKEILEILLDISYACFEDLKYLLEEE